MADLTPEEQRFFETGELQSGMPGAAPSVPDVSPVDPIALAGVATVTPSAIAPAPSSAAPAPAPIAEPAPQADVTELLRRSLAEAQQRAAALEAHIQSTQQAAAPVAPPAPDPSTDPLGSMMHQLDTVNKTVTDLQAALNQQQTQQTQLAQFNGFQQQVRALRDQFAAKTPDFDAAYSHLRESRLADLRAFGMPDLQAQQAIFREELALSESAIRFGRNPAEAIYDMAKRHGFAPKVATPLATPTTPDAKLAAIQQAQAAARNLPKSSNPEDLTVAGLKDASDADLNKMILDPKLWAKITGADEYPL